MTANDLELFDEDLLLRMAMNYIQVLEKELEDSTQYSRLAVENTNFVSKQRDETVAQAKDYFQMIVDLQKENQKLIEENNKENHTNHQLMNELREVRNVLKERGKEIDRLQEIIRSTLVDEQKQDNQFAEYNLHINALKEQVADLQKSLDLAIRERDGQEENSIARGEQIGALNDEIRHLKSRINDLLKRSDMTSEKWAYVEMAVGNAKFYRISAVKMVMVITGMGLAAAVHAWEEHYEEPYNPSLKKESGELDLATMVSVMDGEV